jgi:hypothetical protein
MKIPLSYCRPGNRPKIRLDQSDLPGQIGVFSKLMPHPTSIAAPSPEQRSIDAQ